MKLKEYLKNKKITYRIFSKDLEISEQYLKKILGGLRRPGLLLSLKIEKLTNGQITPQQLVEDFEKASKNQNIV